MDISKNCGLVYNFFSSVKQKLIVLYPNIVIILLFPKPERFTASATENISRQ